MIQRHQKLYNLRSRKQELEGTNFRGKLFRKPLLWTMLSFSLISILLVLASCLIGSLAGLLSKSPFYSPQLIKGLWLTTCIVLSIAAWGIRAKQLNFVYGIWMAGLIIISNAILVAIFVGIKSGIFELDFLWVVIIVPPVFLGGYIVAYLICKFCLTSLKISIQTRSYQNVLYFFILLIISLSILCAYFIGDKPLYDQGISKDFFGLVKIFFGFSGGMAIVFLGVDFDEFMAKNSDLDFLKTCAIAFQAFGNTSFYDFDLSEIDFTGANVANTDFRAAKFYRTCLRGVKGLDRARVDNRYFDIDQQNVQFLLVNGCCHEKNFTAVNLRGAYLQNAPDMREFDFTDAKLVGADLQGGDLRGSTFVRSQLPLVDLQKADLRRVDFTDANLTESNLLEADLRGCLFVRTQVARANFSEADLTGVCIEDWSVSNRTIFTNVRCDYVFRKYENGQPTHRYPSDRNFEPGEFAALFQQPENELELIFKGDFSYSALSLAFDKLKTERPELDLNLMGIEQRGDLWVVRVTSSNPVVEAQLEQQFSSVYQTTGEGDRVTTIKDSIYRDYEDIKQRWAESQQLVRQLTGISESQAEALKQLSKQALGNNFNIFGSTITNLAGSGQIDYTEAAGQIRSLVTRGASDEQVTLDLQALLAQLQKRRVAETVNLQADLISQILLKEAETDRAFKQFLLQQQRPILEALPPGTIATAIQNAIAQLT